jgi:hypothetical protein
LYKEQIGLDCPIEQDLQIGEFGESAKRLVNVNHVEDCRNASAHERIRFCLEGPVVVYDDIGCNREKSAVAALLPANDAITVPDDVFVVEGGCRG